MGDSLPTVEEEEALPHAVDCFFWGVRMSKHVRPTQYPLPTPPSENFMARVFWPTISTFLPFYLSPPHPPTPTPPHAPSLAPQFPFRAVQACTSKKNNHSHICSVPLGFYMYESHRHILEGLEAMRRFVMACVSELIEGLTNKAYNADMLQVLDSCDECFDWGSFASSFLSGVMRTAGEAWWAC